MKVSELIELLSGMPSDAEVRLVTDKRLPVRYGVTGVCTDVDAYREAVVYAKDICDPDDENDDSVEIAEAQVPDDVSAIYIVGAEPVEKSVWLSNVMNAAQ